MKRLYLILLLVSLMPLLAQAQAPDTHSTTTAPDSDTLTDQGEAGGIPAAEAASEKGSASSVPWLLLGISAIAGIAVGAAGMSLAKGKSTKREQAPESVPEPLPAPGEEAGNKAKAPAAEAKRLKQELKALEARMASLQESHTALERNLEVYRAFDSTYFGEAFRKLVSPMNEAMESGSRKDMLENLLRIMIHYSSLTRYKIAKKQPYDEANIHYLLNQKGGADMAATEINGHTPVDKIPKNIKVITDLLKEFGSGGLDDSILAGYKIKNL